MIVNDAWIACFTWDVTEVVERECKGIILFETHSIIALKYSFKTK